MAYRLKETESFSDGIRRIVLEQIDKALDHLKLRVRNKDEAIHDARVCIKKIRAILRMNRDSLGDVTYEKEDTAYRNTARMLSKVRDNAAMLEIVDQLTEHFSDQLAKDAFSNLQSPLKSRKARPQDKKSAMAKAARSLRQARLRVNKWPNMGHQQALARGLKRVFRDGRMNFTTARDQPSVEAFHEWRKEVKHLLYQTHLLRPLWPKAMKALETELKALGEYLSEDHDLAILRDRVSEQLDGSENRTEIEALVALIDQRRNELQVMTGLLGSRIYTEKPRRFAARAESYWRVWRSEVKDDPIVLG